MAENSTYSTPTPYIKKRKHQDVLPDSPPPNSSHRQSGISAPIIGSPGDEIQQPKKRAQEIAAHLDDDYWNDEPNDYGEQMPYGQSQPQQICVCLVPASQVGSKKIEIPIGKVGVIIGKEGDTIKYFEDMSGAKIQADTEAGPSAPTQGVELMGSPDEIRIAEQLINEALAKVPQLFTGQLPGAVHSQMEVRFIIGKNRETIKYLQASSAARIQVSSHTQLGDTPAEKTVHIYGTPTQIDHAKQLISEVISKVYYKHNFVAETKSIYSRRISSSGSSSSSKLVSSWSPPVNQIGFGNVLQPRAYPSQAPQGSSISQPSYPSYPPQPTSGGYSNDHTATYGQQHGGSYGDSGYAQHPAAQQQGYTMYGAYFLPTPQPGYCSQIGALSGYGGSQAAYYQGQYGYGSSTEGGGIFTYGAQGPTEVPPSTLALIGTQQLNGHASYPPQGSVQTSYGSQPGPSHVAQDGYEPPQGNRAASGQMPPPSMTRTGSIQSAPMQSGYALPPTQSGYAQHDSAQYHIPCGYGSAPGYCQALPYGAPWPATQPRHGQAPTYCAPQSATQTCLYAVL
ncbi:hypothetical protein MKW92_012664 [Papaver armeniacum]|nr:hypothetical protein MKW92_012664 [Papaver armeniacum]